MEHVSRAGLEVVVMVRKTVGVWCKSRWRMSLERYVGKRLSGIVVVHAVCLLASRSRPHDAGELLGRAMRYL